MIKKISVFIMILGLFFLTIPKANINGAIIDDETIHDILETGTTTIIDDIEYHLVTIGDEDYYNYYTKPYNFSTKFSDWKDTMEALNITYIHFQLQHLSSFYIYDYGNLNKIADNVFRMTLKYNSIDTLTLQLYSIYNVLLYTVDLFDYNGANYTNNAMLLTNISSFTYNNGYDDGYDEGYEDGYDYGWYDAREEFTEYVDDPSFGPPGIYGYDGGYYVGYKEGKNEGYTDGFDDGLDEVFNSNNLMRIAEVRNRGTYGPSNEFFGFDLPINKKVNSITLLNLFGYVLKPIDWFSLGMRQGFSVWYEDDSEKFYSFTSQGINDFSNMIYIELDEDKLVKEITLVLALNNASMPNDDYYDMIEHMEKNLGIYINNKILNDEAITKFKEIIELEVINSVEYQQLLDVEFQKGYDTAFDELDSDSIIYQTIFEEGRLHGRQEIINDQGGLRMKIIDFLPGVLGSIFLFFLTVSQIGILGITILDILGVVFIVGALVFVIRFFFKG